MLLKPHCVASLALALPHWEYFRDVAPVSGSSQTALEVKEAEGP